jgi:hypothetical protein
LQTSLTEIVRWATDYLPHHAADGDPAIVEAMRCEGVDGTLARELLAFVPLAFCRALFPEPQEIFQPHYDVHDPETDQWQYGLPLKSQPVYQAAHDLALQWRREGKPGKAFLAIAGRSAEFRAINELLNEGSKLEDIRCTAPLIIRRTADSNLDRRKPWWQFWRSGQKHG